MAVTNTSASTAQPRIINSDAGHGKPKLLSPNTYGYLYLAAAVQPPAAVPVVLPSAQRRGVLGELKELARRLEQVDVVRRVTVFRAIVVPPTSRFSAYLKERKAPLHVPDFDVLMLVETTSPQTAREVQADPAYRTIVETTQRAAHTTFTMAARNIRRIGDVDTTSRGLFLFNHFAADVPAIMPELWEHLAGWYTVETGLDNSVAMAPLEGEPRDYAIVNWARWDASPAGHFWHMLSKRSFWRYVTANLEVNHAISMPVYCRVA